jgi:hypothetical protein
MRILRIDANPDNPAALGVEFLDTIGIGGKFGGTDKCEIERIKYE